MKEFDLEDLVNRLVDRRLNSGNGNVGGTTYHERHAIVTSYDPDKYLAKVMYMPEGQESGWLPIETGHIGTDYGFAVGLQPGDGKKKGDQVIVRFQEGDLESGKIVQRVHSDADKPPRVESGEMVMWAKFRQSKGKSEIGDETTDQAEGDNDDQAEGAQGGSGQQFYFKKDGSLVVTDGNGATIKQDGKGNIIIDCNTFTVVAKKDVGLTAGGNAEFRSDGITGIDGGSNVTVQGGGAVSDGSVSPPAGEPNIPPFTVPK